MGKIATIQLKNSKGEITFIDQQDNLSNNTCEFDTDLEAGTYTGLINGKFKIVVNVH